MLHILEIMWKSFLRKTYNNNNNNNNNNAGNLSAEIMTLKTLNKKKQQQQHRNGKLKLFHRNNKFLTPTLHRMLCNALIQPHFHYARST